MERLSELFKALSDPLRLRILRLLFHNGKEAYGEEMASRLGIPPYRLSRHLKVLKASGFIKERRQGRWVYYSLANRHGALLRALHRELDGVSGIRHLPNGERPRRRARQPEAPFNWNEGPAVPGVL